MHFFCNCLKISANYFCCFWGIFCCMAQKHEKSPFRSERGLYAYVYYKERVCVRICALFCFRSFRSGRSLLTEELTGSKLFIDRSINAEQSRNEEDNQDQVDARTNTL